MSITGTQLTETASYLGSYSAEAFALGRRPATTALTLSAAYSFSPTWVLAGQFTTATTPGYSNETASLISGVQASRASGFGVALVKTATWTQRDRLSFSVSQPLRAQSGAINFDLPVDVDASGNVLRATESVSLKPSGRERISELHYALPVSKEATLGLAAIHRVQPNHEAAAPTERVVALRFSARF